jgi:hypothetical protein
MALFYVSMEARFTSMKLRCAICDVVKSLSCLKDVSGGYRDANFGVLGARRIIFYQCGLKAEHMRISTDLRFN